jgi:hypothetical protein
MQIHAPIEVRRRVRTIPPRNDTQSGKRDGVDERLTDKVRPSRGPMINSAQSGISLAGRNG